MPLEGRVFCQFVAGSPVESAGLTESPEGGLALKHEVRCVRPGDGEGVALGGSGVASGLRSVAAHSQEVYAHLTVDKITLLSSLLCCGILAMKILCVQGRNKCRI